MSTPHTHDLSAFTHSHAFGDAAAPKRERALWWVTWITLATMVLVADSGPALYRGERLGRGKRTFWMYKIRTLRRDAALKKAVQQAIWEHKQLGNPICTWRDGRVVWIPPEEIEVEKPQDD